MRGRERVMTNISYDILEYASFESQYAEEVSWENAWVGHLAFAWALVAELRPSLLVELGTYKGVSFFAFCQSVLAHGLSTRCVAVDSWEGDEQVGFYSEDAVYNRVKEHRDAHYAAFAELKRQYFDDAAADFDDASIDIMHIDGLHTYDAVRHDFETWLPKVKPGGIILLHDVNEFRETFGAYRLWDEIALLSDETHLFRHSHGLGVWRKPGGAALESAWLAELLRGNSREALLVDGYLKLISECDVYRRKSAQLQDWFLHKEKEADALREHAESLVRQVESLAAVADERAALLDQAVEEHGATRCLLEESRCLLEESRRREERLLRCRSMRLTAPLRAVAGWLRGQRKRDAS